ncbi:hypothetical protein BJ165DRAFT_1612343 [Panaeolus papilionaceus]|nr:hypothetical protein BJ165DRAFT_1612343 [Panaeolus papilionaceus]
MSRGNRHSIELELRNVDTQLEILKQRDLDFQGMLDNLQRMKEENIKEMQELQGKRSELMIQQEPINWLPTEVLTQVFLAFNEHDFEDINYRPAMVVSHVCKRWRAIALASQPLWSRVLLQGFSKPDLMAEYLSRSGLSSLQVAYRRDSETPTEAEVIQFNSFLSELKSSFSRTRSLSIECSVALPFVSLVESLQQHRTVFPHLQTLSLAITTPNPSFQDTPVLIRPDGNSAAADGSTIRVARWLNSLRHLKLQEIPLFNFPSSFYSAITSLELSYSPRKADPSDTDYFLKASTLCQFLVETPLLENLVIVNTVPVWDITLPIRDISPESPDQPSRRRYPIPLHHLKSLDWTYPLVVDVQRFLYLIDTPKLEKLDVWLDDQPKRPGTSASGGHTAAGVAGRKICNLPHLRDFSFQCANTDSLLSLLHKLFLPTLEKAEFTNIDPSVRSGDSSEQTKLPAFPRLESIFRDPRLPNLTHLTLSHYTILPEGGGAETILGYMPALTSLSLDSCLGVGKLVAGFQEKVVGYITRGGTVGVKVDDGRERENATRKATKPNLTQRTRTRRIVTVKCCPRLEALSFWNCHDLEIDSLRGVIRTRNEEVIPVEDGVSNEGLVDSSKSELVQGRRDKVTPSSSGNGMKHARNGDVDDGKSRTSPTSPSVRKIKPLRRPRHQTTKSVDSDQDNAQTLVPESTDSPDAMSGIALKHTSPAQIIFLRVSNCKLLTREDVLAFQEYDVLDILWSGSD